MLHPSKKNRIVSRLYWHIGRFEVLVGVAVLTVASAFMALSSRRHLTEQQNPAWMALNSGVCVTPLKAD